MRSRLKRWIFESYDSVFITFFRQILTKDSVTVFVNAIMYYKVNDKKLRFYLIIRNSDNFKLSSFVTIFKTP